MVLEDVVADAWATMLERWTNAQLIDPATAERIRAWELARATSSRLRWPVWIALGFGALMLGAGVLLFVSAHWDTLSPQARFLSVLALVAAFHIAAAVADERFPAMATALHAVGTIALGAGIYLAGQIFNLAEHWPGGLMLWAAGAAGAWALVRTWPQLTLTALLVPAWLTAEWIDASEFTAGAHFYRVPAFGLLMLALAYFTAFRPTPGGAPRRALTWVGGVALGPAAIGLAFASGEPSRYFASLRPLAAPVAFLGWSLAIALPLLTAFVLRGPRAWRNAVAAGWALALLWLPHGWTVAPYVWWVVGAIGLAAWGIVEARTERIDVAAAVFATTMLCFYFSHVMNKLERSASLTGLGLLFLVGGWAIERGRRRLVARARGDQS
jgi:hypothetical protein